VEFEGQLGSFAAAVFHDVKRSQLHRPSADTAPALVALGAQIKIVGAAGEKIIPLESFYSAVDGFPGEKIFSALVRSSPKYSCPYPKPEQGIPPQIARTFSLGPRHRRRRYRRRKQQWRSASCQCNNGRRGADSLGARSRRKNLCVVNG
jgi:hypothetical protein